MHNVHTWWHTNLSTGIHVMTTQQLTCRCNTPTESCLSRKLCLKGSKAKVQTCNTSRQHNNLVAITPVAQSRSLNYWVRLGRCYMLMIYLCGQNSCWQHCCRLLKCCLNSRCPSAISAAPVVVVPLTISSDLSIFGLEGPVKSFPAVAVTASLAWSNMQFWMLRWPTLSAGPTPSLMVVLHLQPRETSIRIGHVGIREEQPSLRSQMGQQTWSVMTFPRSPTDCISTQLQPSNLLDFSSSCRNPLSSRSMNPNERDACCRVKWNIECNDVISIQFSFL